MADLAAAGTELDALGAALGLAAGQLAELDARIVALRDELARCVREGADARERLEGLEGAVVDAATQKRRAEDEAKRSEEALRSLRAQAEGHRAAAAQAEEALAAAEIAAAEAATRRGVAVAAARTRGEEAARVGEEAARAEAAAAASEAAAVAEAARAIDAERRGREAAARLAAAASARAREEAAAEALGGDVLKLGAELEEIVVENRRRGEEASALRRKIDAAVLEEEKLKAELGVLLRERAARRELADSKSQELNSLKEQAADEAGRLREVGLEVERIKSEIKATDHSLREAQGEFEALQDAAREKMAAEGEAKRRVEYARSDVDALTKKVKELTRTLELLNKERADMQGRVKDQVSGILSSFSQRRRTRLSRPHVNAHPHPPLLRRERQKKNPKRILRRRRRRWGGGGDSFKDQKERKNEATALTADEKVAWAAQGTSALDKKFYSIFSRARHGRYVDVERALLSNVPVDAEGGGGGGALTRGGRARQHRPADRVPKRWVERRF